MKAILIDDERLAREDLKILLRAYPQIDIIAEAKNTEEGILLVNELKPELIFVDVDMPGLSGLEMIQHLHEIPKVVFVTAYDKFALKAFELNALDYLVKPVDPNRLKETILRLQLPEEDLEIEEIIRQDTLSLEQRIFIKDGEKCYFLQLKDVRYFESDGNYIKVYYDNKRALLLSSLNNLEAKLNPQDFFRANRKFVVNLNHIKEIENWFNGGLKITLHNGEEIEISRRQALRFKEMFAL